MFLVVTVTLLLGIGGASCQILAEDYHNGEIGTNFLVAATSFAVNEVRPDGEYIGVTTNLSFAACRCNQEIGPGDSLFLLTDIYRRQSLDDTYDSLMQDGELIKKCMTIVFVVTAIPPNFLREYIECTDLRNANASPTPAPAPVMPGGWSKADTNSDDIIQAAQFATSAVGAQSNSLYRFALHMIVNASSQIVAGVNWKFTFVQRATLCRNMATDLAMPLYKCDALPYDGNAPERYEFQICDATVWDEAWRTPRYMLSNSKCTSLGLFTAGEFIAWFMDGATEYKLSTSAQAPYVTEAQYELVNADWLALFELGGAPSQIAASFAEFATSFNRTYTTTSNGDNTEVDFRYFRFTQNAARVKVAQLAELGTATYDLSTTQYADQSMSEYCTALTNYIQNTFPGQNLALADVTEIEQYLADSIAVQSQLTQTEQYGFLQFYVDGIVSSWSPIYNSAVMRLVTPADGVASCAGVTFRVAEYGEGACSQTQPLRYGAKRVAPTKCTVSFWAAQIGFAPYGFQFQLAM